MQPEWIIIICELIGSIVLLRLCIVLIGQKRRYRAWKLEQKTVGMKENFK